MIKITLCISILITFSSCCTLKVNTLDSNGQKKGRWIVVNENPKDSLNFSIVKYSEDIINGKSFEYYKNGMVAEGNYKDDRKVGEWIVYDKDRKEIVKKLFYTDGFLSRIEIIKDGKVIKQAITDPPF